MTGTPKSLRQPRERVFENYILTRSTAPSINLTTIPDILFLPCSPSSSTETVGQGDPGRGYTRYGISTPIDIGFDFNFDGTSYKKFVASTSGWLALVDPELSFSSSHVLNDPLAATGCADATILSRNDRIKAEFTGSHALLAPWFDDLRNIASDVTQVYSSSLRRQRVQQGIEPLPASVNPSQFGTKFYRDDKSPEGKRLIVRWNSLADLGSQRDVIIRFESVLYENGVIEFRYAPRELISLVASGTTSNAAGTCGIFMSGGENRFRDFSLDLGYRNGDRQQYQFGGAVYSASIISGSEVPSYTDTDFYLNNSASYTINLQPYLHWPGTTGAGSMFRFTPPLNLRRVLPRLESGNRSSKINLPTVARTGDGARRGNDPIAFDDRRTLMYVASEFSEQTVIVTEAGIDSGESLFSYYIIGYGCFGDPIYGICLGCGGGSTETTTTVLTLVASSSVLVNAPSMLQRYYGDSEPSIVARQNVFAGDLEFLARIPKDVGEQWIQVDNAKSIEPFSEYKLFESDPATVDTRFFSGSNITEVGDGLSYPLRSKTQIRFSLPVNASTVLQPMSSTIHYYNRRTHAWGIPRNSTYSLANDNSTTNDSGVSKGDVYKDLSLFISGNTVANDYKGFGPVGNVVCSGSHTPSTWLDTNDASINAQYTTENVAIALSKQYDKSICIADDYKATDDEVFEIPINQPFILEKAVIEIPFAAGNGWFEDKTTAISPFLPDAYGNMQAFDFGGPALTIALFNQTTAGNESRRDLILTGTITHQFDDTSVIYSIAKSGGSATQNYLYGFRAFGAVPSAVVAPFSSSVTGSSTYTGSVVVPCEAQVSNGVFVHVKMTALNSTAVSDIINTEEIVLENRTYTNYSQSCNIAFINNFGRGGTGFDPSPRSVFGKEFATSQAVSSKGRIANPFNDYGTGDLAAYNGTTEFHLALPLESTRPSPYLIKPHDKLVLAVAKTRPVILSGSKFADKQYETFYVRPSAGGGGGIDYVRHDVQLLTGAINIVLYGSMLREGKEFHDTLNQPLSSDAIHELVIGNEPVLDQFETEYRNTFVSGSNDDYIDGNLLRFGIVNGDKTFITGSRGKVFSRTNAREVTSVGTSGYDNTNSLEFRLQPYYEKAGTTRVKQVTDNAERFWDSLMPSVDECFRADGAEIFMLSSQSIGTSNTLNYSNFGFIWFDYQLPAYLSTSGSTMHDGIWTKSYPFEPRYSAIARQQTIEKSFKASKLVSFTGTAPNIVPTITDVRPRPVNGFFFGPAGSTRPSYPPAMSTNLDPSVVNPSQYHNWLFVSNIDVVTNLTTSAGNDNVMKALFGFGDLNNMISTSLGTNTTFGTNHFADFRKKYSESSTWGSWFGVSPIIRGWKYGVYSGLAANSRAYYRNGSYGQFRDMLEQRVYTKYFTNSTANSDFEAQQQGGVSPAAVTVKFIDTDTGKSTDPINTSSQNLSFEATSSVPYLDGVARNRVAYEPRREIAEIHVDTFGQLTIQGCFG